MAIETMSESQRISSIEASNKRTPSSNLDKDDFLKLLCTQLQNQDPTSPMEDMEFISEMASFSSLEQMLNIGEDVKTLTSNVTNTNKANQALMYLGTTVTAATSDEEGDALTGKVEMVGFDDGEPFLKVGDYALSLDQIKLAAY